MPHIKRTPLGQLGGTKGTGAKGTAVSKSDQKRRKSSQLLRREKGKGPSDNRFNIHRRSNGGAHKENR